MGARPPIRMPSTIERLLPVAFLLVAFVVLCRLLLWFQDFPQGWAAFSTICEALLVSAILTFGLFGRSPPPVGIRAIGIRTEGDLWSRGQVTFHSMFAGLAFTILFEAISRIQQPMLDLSLSIADYVSIVLSAVVLGGSLSWFVLVRLPFSRTCMR